MSGPDIFAEAIWIQESVSGGGYSHIYVKWSDQALAECYLPYVNSQLAPKIVEDLKRQYCVLEGE